MKNETPQTALPSRGLIGAFVLVVLVSLRLLTLSWDASLLDRYEFRQLQTALSTFWIAQEGWQLNYLTPLFGPPWSVPMEFPTYQVLVAGWHHVTGMPLEASGRLVSIIGLLLCLPALYDLLAVANLSASRRLIVLMLVLTSPVYLFYGRTFMIETTALCLAVWFLATYRRALLSGHWGWLIATTLLATLAALTKVTTFALFGIPAAALAIASLRTENASIRTLGATLRHGAVSLIPAVVSISLTAWWLSHSDAVKDSNPFTGFLTSRELRGWNFGDLSLRWDWSFWVHVQENIVGYNLAEGAIALALLCLPFAPGRARWLAAVAFAGFAAGPLVFANLYHIHDYYYAANSLLLAAAAGVLIASAWDDSRLPRGTNWLILSLMIAFQWHAFYRGYASHHRQPAPPPPPLAAVIRDHVPAEGVVLIYGADWNPLLPYYFQRRAVMVPGERENETDVLAQIVAQLPPRKIAAMVIHGKKLLARPDFMAERAAHFGFAPVAAVTEGDTALFLPADAIPSGRSPISTTPRQASTTVLTPPPWPTDLQPAELPAAAHTLFNPLPQVVRTRYGISAAELGGRPILNAHAPAEFAFNAPPSARHVRIVAGLPDAAFGPGQPATTDGISLELLMRDSSGQLRVLAQRQLNPAQNPADRGPQPLEATLPAGFAGELIFRLGNGPANNPTNDWAYCVAVEIR